MKALVMIVSSLRLPYMSIARILSLLSIYIWITENVNYSQVANVVLVMML